MLNLKKSCRETVIQIAYQGTAASMRRLGLVALTLGLPLAVQAATVFDNGAPDQVSGVNMSSGIVAEDFTLASATFLTGIHFWSTQSSAGDYTGSLGISFYSDNAGTPGNLLAGSASATTPLPRAGLDAADGAGGVGPNTRRTVVALRNGRAKAH